MSINPYNSQEENFALNPSKSKSPSAIKAIEVTVKRRFQLKDRKTPVLEEISHSLSFKKTEQKQESGGTTFHRSLSIESI